jgi:hypothetical protein
MFLGEDGHYMLDVANTGRGPTRFKVQFKKQWFFASSSMESDGSFRVLK